MYFCKNVLLHFKNDSWNLCFNKDIPYDTAVLSVTNIAWIISLFHLTVMFYLPIQMYQ
jgi:hypothetical protein